MTHNDFDHLAQLLPEERSPCAVGSNMLHSVFIQPGFVVAISILQSSFFFNFTPVHSYTTGTLQGYNTLVAKSIQKHLFQQAIPDGVFLGNPQSNCDTQIFDGHGASICCQFFNALLNIIREFISANNMAKGEKKKILEDSLIERISS